jgi:hypothetical protein
MIAMFPNKQWFVGRGAIIAALLVVGAVVAATPATAHEDGTNGEHCHLDVSGGALFTKSLMTYSVGILKKTAEAFVPPIGYVKNPFVSECHGYIGA